VTITLEQIHEEILNVKQEIQGLKQCIHEDRLELNEQTIRDIEQSRQELKEGKGIPLHRIEEKLKR